MALVEEPVAALTAEVAVPINLPALDRAPRKIVLFDGVCNVCHTFVSFIFPRDKNKKFFFQAMQSKKGREILASWNLPPNLNTVILIDEGTNTYYLKSTAIFNILAELQQPWSYLYYGLYIPRPLRDLGYTGFANIRYMVFGKKDECTFYPGLKDRFIDWRSPIVEIEDASKDM